MKISPMPSQGQTAGAVTGGPDIRSVKMDVNRTPGQTEAPPAAQELTIQDNGSDPKAVTEATEPLSPELADLAKKRRFLQVKEKELADREKALSTAPTKVTGIDAAKLKSDPIGVLLDNGVTYDQLTEAVLARQGSTETRALKAEIDALKADFDKRLTDKDAQVEQQVLAELSKDAKRLTAQGDTFELVKLGGHEKDAVELVRRIYRESGEMVDIVEALTLIENELLDDALKITAAKKVQSKIVPAPAPQPPQQQRQMRTLTNRDTASVPLTAKQRALAAFNGTLKK